MSPYDTENFEETLETLRAIREGEVDAFVVHGPDGECIAEHRVRDRGPSHDVHALAACGGTRDQGRQGVAPHQDDRCAQPLRPSSRRSGRLDRRTRCRTEAPQVGDQAGVGGEQERGR